MKSGNLEPDPLQVEADTLKHLQAESGQCPQTTLDAFPPSQCFGATRLPAMLQPSLGFRLRIASPLQNDGTGNRAFRGQLVRQHRTDEPLEKLAADILKKEQRIAEIVGNIKELLVEQ